MAHMHTLWQYSAEISSSDGQKSKHASSAEQNSRSPDERVGEWRRRMDGRGNEIRKASRINRERYEHIVSSFCARIKRIRSPFMCSKFEYLGDLKSDWKRVHTTTTYTRTHTRQNWKVGERVWRYFFFVSFAFCINQCVRSSKSFCTRALSSISFTLSTVLNSNSVGVKILFHFRSCGSMAAAQFPHPPDTPGHHFFSSCLSGRLSWPRTLSLVHSRRTRNGEMLIKQ